MAVNGTTLIKKYLSEAGLLADVGYEFSPEEFTDTDIDFSVEVCEKVREAWGKDSGGDFILNLPATVERRPPYQYADMIEYFCGKYKYPEDTVISVHAHNDQGCAVAATEMALLAGAHRVEGTLFGHGERTGNVDIVTIALNFQSRGIETGLDFSNIASIVEVVEKMSYIPVHQRHPYAGDLVFTAFSGSHQDAIRKGLAQEKESREIFGSWKIPYLHINPTDIGRKYEKIIRINSQSGKGGAVYILENDFGYRPPKRIHPEIGEIVQKLADRKKTEIGAEELLKEFKRNFFNIGTPLKLNDFAIISSDKPNHIKAKLSITLNGVKSELEGEGNGPVSAAVHALTKQDDILKFTLKDFDEQSLGHSEDATAIAYVSISREEDGKVFCGAGEHSNIEYAALLAVFSAINKAWKNKK
jgi:2-isopropylmalate synthase